MVAFCDQAGTVRAGEELNLARLRPFLLDHFAHSGPVSVEQFPSGHSNLTYLVRLGSQEVVLRRPPFGSKVRSAHDMAREYRVLSKLHGAYPLAPKAILYCEIGRASCRGRGEISVGAVSLKKDNNAPDRWLVSNACGHPPQPCLAHA